MGYTYVNSKGTKYYLNSKKVTLRGGKEQVIYFFSKDERPESAAEMPDGFEVVESARNSFVTLKRKR